MFLHYSQTAAAHIYLYSNPLMYNPRDILLVAIGYKAE